MRDNRTNKMRDNMTNKMRDYRTKKVRGSLTSKIRYVQQDQQCEENILVYDSNG